MNENEWKDWKHWQTSTFLFTRTTSQSPCLHETLALLSASGACLATTETECRGRDNYEKLAERVSHSLIFPVKWYMIVLCEKNNLIFFTYMGKREKAKSANQVAEMLNIDRSTLYRKWKIVTGKWQRDLFLKWKMIKIYGKLWIEMWEFSLLSKI